MKCLNNEKHKDLGWRSPFEIYFWKKSNELVRYGLPKNRGSPEVRKVLKPTKSDLNIFKKLNSKTRKHALDSNEKVARRTVEDLRKRKKYSTYKINQKVMVRYGKKGKTAPKRRYFWIGKIEKVGFRDLVNNQRVSSWFSVEDATDLQVQASSNKKKVLEKKFTKESEKW